MFQAWVASMSQPAVPPFCPVLSSAHCCENWASLGTAASICFSESSFEPGNLTVGLQGCGCLGGRGAVGTHQHFAHRAETFEDLELRAALRQQAGRAGRAGDAAGGRRIELHDPVQLAAGVVARPACRMRSTYRWP